MTIDWIRKAAEEIHDRLPEIEAEAGQAGVAAQDIDVDRATFVGMVEEIIQRHAHAHIFQCESNGTSSIPMGE